jgi:3-methylcrotonyl-CoA carboxylase alpha subunit
MRLRCGELVFEPRLRQADGMVHASLGEATVAFAIEALAEGVYLVREGGCVRTLHLAREGGCVHVFWEGRVFTLTEEREGARRGHRPDAAALEAPMPGRVSAVRAVAGERVVRGQELLVIEAMKMENALRSPRDGVVRAVHVSVGEMVAPGRALVEIGE